MSKQDWLDYFEAVNGRSASAEEIAQALAAGEFQEEVVVPETPQAPEFVAAPTAPSSSRMLQRQLPLLKNQSQLLKLQSLLQRQQHLKLQSLSQHQLLLQKNQ